MRTEFRFSKQLWRGLVTLSLCAALCAPLVRAQDKAPIPRVGVETSEQKPLTLEEAITLALRNNNDIDASRDEVRMAEFSLQASRGAYDPRFTTESLFQRAVTPVASSLGGGSADGSVTQTNAVANARLSGLAPKAGGSYQFEFNSSRTTTNNQFASLNPQFPSALTFNYTQPLWRGLRTDDSRRQIQIAKKNLALSDAQFRQKTIEVITNVTQAYWDLVFALRNLEVQTDAVKQARAQSESNKRQVEQGVLAPVDIVAADAQVSNFEQNVYAAQEAVTRAENALKTLLLPERNAPLWSQALLPTTPANIEPPGIALPDAVSNALANRPELQQLQTSAEVNEIDTRYFRDQAKPQIDLVATYTSNGLAGSEINGGSNPLTAGFAPLFTRLNDLSARAGLPPLPPFTTTGGGVPSGLAGGYGQSLSNLLSQKFPTTQVGVRITLPLGNRTAAGNLGRALAEGSKIKNQRAQLEQQIEADVRNAMQAVRSAEARVKAAAAARSSSEQLYNSEQHKLQAGISTVFLALQRQTDLINARGRELQAQTDLSKAIAQFQRATGNTLAANHITVRGEASK